MRVLVGLVSARLPSSKVTMVMCEDVQLVALWVKERKN